MAIRVQVLMSTYNGEKYIRQQIDSILKQKMVQVALYIRDDGSTDGTVEILENYTQRYSNVYVQSGENKGIQKSFFELLKQADESMGYFAFSDQDDVWHPFKLYEAVKILEKQKKDIPCLYAGKVIYASENLEEKKKFRYQLHKPFQLGNALVENVCMGCTEVFNKSLLELVREHLPDSDILHDWWLYLTAACFGKVFYDDRAFILYRQHSKNQIGMQDTWHKRWFNRFLHIKMLHGKLSAQAMDFQRAYGVMPGTYREIGLVAEYKNDWKKKYVLLTGNFVYRQNRIDTLAYKILFAVNYL